MTVLRDFDRFLLHPVSCFHALPEPAHLLILLCLYPFFLFIQTTPDSHNAPHHAPAQGSVFRRTPAYADSGHG